MLEQATLRTMNNDVILADSCFFIALYDERDQHHLCAEIAFRKWFVDAPFVIAIPDPVMLEVLNTRFVRRPEWIRRLDEHWTALRRQGQLLYIDDFKYRGTQLEDIIEQAQKFETNRNGYRDLSLIDRILRQMILGSSQPYVALLTYNVKDFSDVCQKAGIDLIG
ncbi:MAG: hypothetical protein ACYCYO_08390 [Bacilli bacterium]